MKQTRGQPWLVNRIGMLIQKQLEAKQTQSSAAED